MDTQTQQQMRIEERGAMDFVGLQLVCPAGDPSGIGAFWHKFFSVWEQIQARRDIWGVSIPLNDGTGSFTYMACCEVDPAAYGADWQLPEGLHHHAAPPARYAIFPFVGTPEEMGKAIRRIFGEQLPAAGLQALPGNPLLEFYPPDCYEEGSNIFKCELLALIV